MGRSRRARRRTERQRARRPSRSRSLSWPARVGLVVGGVGLVVAGILLVAAGGSQNAARLGRVAGILILLGLVGIGVGAIGKL